ncbi:maltokinase N-terminal cap-like domain-containing protein [Cryobacterium tagatosivorans]|uniref:maltokinase N-terminal cap-like domain-containing protein n=1 Tax=Cryobacterium tagatosivorans TaxID=1259199 RepID=UPI00141ADC7E|nr:phosphotransferase [Cryobacterium tagatosivorans]
MGEHRSDPDRDVAALARPGADRGTALPEYVNRWVARQRWYGGTGRLPALRSIGDWTLPTTEPGVSIRTHLVLDTASPELPLFQLPLTERVTALAQGEPALVGRGAGGVFVYDAPQDPGYAPALLSFILGRASSPAALDHDASAHGETLPAGTAAADAATVVASRVVSGEQSNTSIIVDTADAHGIPSRPIICKVFRAVHHGENPDVVLQPALAAAGSRFVPAPLGCLLGEWDDPGQPDGRARGHLAFAQEFLPGVEDAWRVALAAAEAGDDFSAEARTLGEATASVHADLARAMPTREATPEFIGGVFEGMCERLRAAAQEVPALGAYRPAIEAVFGRVRSAPWPRLQRIHGDYHLGQVLHAPGRGWVLVDFEGEPLRPMHERDQPDVALRDVAGMLRSFSYSAGTIGMAHPERDPARAAEWAAACRRAFLEGYAARSGRDVRDDGALLDAFELDKAVYETVYETRNRPAWLPIPLAAIRSLVEAAAGTAR